MVKILPKFHFRLLLGRIFKIVQNLIQKEDSLSLCHCMHLLGFVVAIHVDADAEEDRKNGE